MGPVMIDVTILTQDANTRRLNSTMFACLEPVHLNPYLHLDQVHT